MYGHIYRLAEAIAEGATVVAGTQVEMRRVPETLSEEILGKMGAIEPQKAFTHIPVCKVDELASADAILFWYADKIRKHVRADAAVPRCNRGTLGKRLACWQGGKRLYEFQHTARRSGVHDSEFSHYVLHQGMVIVGLPYTFQGQIRMDEIMGGSPYGTSTIAGSKGERMPNQNELAAARFQGRHVAAIAFKLTK
jgi:NAD(P)H dehydrogenase (quinone)